jgi:predicted transcriptional regulator of viral defense system
MKKKLSKAEKVLIMARERGILRVRDVTEKNIHPEYLRRLCAEGLLVRTGRGLYTLAGSTPTENYSLAQACKRVPHGVVCLLSALGYYEIGTQNPHEVWLAVDRKAARPRVDYPPLRIMRFSGKALIEGVETKKIEGVPVKVYCPAKTVADCFKYRNKIGLDVAIEALRDCRRKRKATNDELWHYAKICRVANVMKPYLEATL